MGIFASYLSDIPSNQVNPCCGDDEKKACAKELPLDEKTKC